MSCRLVKTSLGFVRKARTVQLFCRNHQIGLFADDCFERRLNQRTTFPRQGIIRFSTSRKLYQEELNPIMEIKFEELRDLLQSKSVVLVDVRERKELVEDGKILDSINVPLGEVESALSLSPDQFESKYGGHLPSQEESAKLVLSCRSGKRAAMALEKARKLGFEGARCYSGSFQDWVANGGALEKP